MIAVGSDGVVKIGDDEQYCTRRWKVTLPVAQRASPGYYRVACGRCIPSLCNRYRNPSALTEQCTKQRSPDGRSGCQSARFGGVACRKLPALVEPTVKCPEPVDIVVVPRRGPRFFEL